jgi:hypothetical protein
VEPARTDLGSLRRRTIATAPVFFFIGILIDPAVVAKNEALTCSGDALIPGFFTTD